MKVKDLEKMSAGMDRALETLPYLKAISYTLTTLPDGQRVAHGVLFRNLRTEDGYRVADLFEFERRRRRVAGKKEKLQKAFDAITAVGKMLHLSGTGVGQCAVEAIIREITKRSEELTKELSEMEMELMRGAWKCVFGEAN